MPNDPDHTDANSMDDSQKLTALINNQRTNYAANHKVMTELTSTVNGLEVALRGSVTPRAKGLIQNVEELQVEVEDLKEKHAAHEETCHPPTQNNVVAEVPAPTVVAAIPPEEQTRLPRWLERILIVVGAGAVGVGGSNAGGLAEVLKNLLGG